MLPAYFLLLVISLVPYTLLFAVPTHSLKTQTFANGKRCHKSISCKSGYCHHGHCDEKKGSGFACYKNVGCISGICKNKRCQQRLRIMSNSSKTQISSFSRAFDISSSTPSFLLTSLLSPSSPSPTTIMDSDDSSVSTDFSDPTSSNMAPSTFTSKSSTLSSYSGSDSSVSTSLASTSSISSSSSMPLSSVTTLLGTASSLYSSASSILTSSATPTATQIIFTPSERQAFESLGISETSLDLIAKEGLPLSTKEANEKAIHAILNTDDNQLRRKRDNRDHDEAVLAAISDAMNITSIQRRNILPTCEVKNLTTCTNPTQKPGPIKTNGCGPIDSPKSTSFLNFVAPALYGACNNHDICFGTCGSNFNTCNLKFLKDAAVSCISPSYIKSVTAACRTVASLFTGGTLNCVLEFEALCAVEAALFPLAVASLGCYAYVNAQKDACKCASDHDCLLDYFSEVDDYGRELNDGHIICTSPSCGGNNLSPEDDGKCVTCFHERCDTAFTTQIQECEDNTYSCQLPYCPDVDAQHTPYCLDNISKCFEERGKCYNKARTSRCQCNASCVGQFNNQCSKAGGPLQLN